MIYFVDEDKNELEPYVYELEARGYTCQILRNADLAFDHLVTANDIEIVIVDVMLSTAESGRSRFDAVSTRNFIITGIRLLEELIEHQERKHSIEPSFPKKAILYSSARIEEVVSEIENVSSTYNIPYLDKNSFVYTPDFADAIIKRMSELN